MQSLFCLCRKTHAEDWPSAPGLHVLGLHVAEDASDWKQRQVSRVEQQVSWVFQVYRSSSFTQRRICPIQPFFTAWYHLHSAKKKKTCLGCTSCLTSGMLFCGLAAMYDEVMNMPVLTADSGGLHSSQYIGQLFPPLALGTYCKSLWTYMHLSNMAISHEQEQYWEQVPWY